MKSLLYKSLFVICFLIFSGTAYAGINISLIMIDQGGAITNEFYQGEEMRFIIIATNPTVQQLTIKFVSGQKYDIAIYNVNQCLIWNWAYDKFFTQMQTELIFNPFMTRLFIECWYQISNNGDELLPGTYAVYVTSPSGEVFTGPYQFVIIGE